MKIAIIGDGGWGTTLSILLHKKGFDTVLWGAFPDYIESLKKERINEKFLPGVEIPKNILLTADLKEALLGSEMVVLAIPSQYMRRVLEKISSCGIQRQIFISVAKGIETDTLMRMSEVILEVLGRVDIAVISGPSIAPEVARGMPTTVVCSSLEENLAKKVRDIFKTERFRIYINLDILGVELGGSLKNIIAIACGISDGLGFGANSKAALMTRGLAEMSRLGGAMGAKKETFNGLSGLGDLVTTCISPFSRNRRVGEEIAKGKKLNEILKGMEMVAEGIKTSKAALLLGEKFNRELPITKEVYSVLYEDKNPLVAVNDLMTREPRGE